MKATPEILQAIAASIAAELEAAGIANATALAERSAGRLQRDFGGSFVYIPKGPPNLEKRNAAIRRCLAGGASCAAVGRKFGLSKMQISRIGRAPAEPPSK